MSHEAQLGQNEKEPRDMAVVVKTVFDERMSCFHKY